MKICVFCSANANLPSSYVEAAESLGRWAAAHGHTVVFGGCDLGLMAVVARAARQAGGMTIGVVPKKVEERGAVSVNMDVHIPCENLTDRKELMMIHGDIFVALPGGIGTLDEIFTVAASATIGYHSKSVILYNVDGFWTPLCQTLDAMEAAGLMRGRWRERILVADGSEELERLLADRLDPAVENRPVE